MHDATPMPASAAQTAPLPAPRARTMVLLAVAVGSSSLLTGWVGAEDEETVEGQLRAPSVTVRIPDGSRVANWLVKEGAQVAEQTDLATLVDPQAKQKLDRQQRVVAALTTDLRRREAKAAVELAWRIRSIESEILVNQLKAADLIQKHYDQKIELHAWRATLQSQSRQVADTNSPDDVFQTVSYKPGTVFQKPLVSLQQFEAARNSTEVTKVQLQLCEDRLKELEKLKVSLPADIRRAAGVDETKSKLALAKKELESLRQRQGNRIVRSPAWGKLRFASGRDDSTRAQSVRIVDDEHRYLIVTVPSRLLGRFQPGKTVEVRFNNHVRHSGVVERINEPAADADSVTLLVQPRGRLWPGVPLGTAARVVVPEDD